MKDLYLSHSTTKPTKWPVHLAKTQISLGIGPAWSVSSLGTQTFLLVFRAAAIFTGIYFHDDYLKKLSLTEPFHEKKDLSDMHFVIS